MSDKNHVRNRAIKMAFENPHLREKMLPLIKKLSGDKAKTEEGAKKLFEKYMDGLTPEGRKNTKKKPQDFYEKPSDSKSESSKSGDKAKKLEETKKKIDDIDDAMGYGFDPHFVGQLEGLSDGDWHMDLTDKEQNLIKNHPMAYEAKIKASEELDNAISIAKKHGVDFDVKGAGITKEFWSNAKQKDYLKLDDVIQDITRKLEEKKLELENEADKLSKEVEDEKKAPKKKPSDSKPEKKPRENGELPIGDKGQQKRKQMSKADKLKAYQEAIKNSKSMSPEDKKKALEKSKKPGFDADAALGAMGEDEEEDGGKTASSVRHELLIWVGNLNLQDFLKDVQRYMGRDWKVSVGYTVGDQKLLYLESATSSDWTGLAIQTALDIKKIFDLPKKFKSEFDGVRRLENNLYKKRDFVKAMRSPEVQPTIQKMLGKTAKKDTTLRAQVIRLAHDNPELRSDLLPLLQQAKVASMPRKDKRPATPKSRQEWGHWFENDLRMKLEAVGASEGDIDHAIGAINHSMYGVLKLVDDKKAWPLSQGYRHFRTNADIYAWATGRGRLSEFTYNSNIPQLPDLQTYPKWVKYVTSQARTAGKKVASMPPANGRPAGEKSRYKWADWLTTDIQTKLEEAGVPQSAIDDAVNRVCDWRYGILFNKRFPDKKFYSFKTNADIHAWVTGRAKLTDLSPNADGSRGHEGRIQGFTESYLMLLKWYIAKYGSANNDVLRDKCKALFNKCKDYQCALAASNAYIGRDTSVRFLVKNHEKYKKELASAIEESSVDTLKMIAESLEWAAKIPKPPQL